MKKSAPWQTFSTGWTAALRVAVDDSKISVIVVDAERNNGIQYCNPISKKYAADFTPSRISTKEVTEYFAHFLIATYMEALPAINELVLSLKGNSGATYNIKLYRHNIERTYTICTEPLSPLVGQRDIQQELLPLLSPTEQKVALLIVQGRSNQQIADNMFISLSTVKTHVNHIFTKLNVVNRTSLIAKLNGTILAW